ncbi:hypothetical protein [Candidatus Lokiarchaeum ossiferum]
MVKYDISTITNGQLAFNRVWIIDQPAAIPGIPSYLLLCVAGCTILIIQVKKRHRSKST